MMTRYRFLLFEIFIILFVYACTSATNNKSRIAHDSLAIAKFETFQIDTSEVDIAGRLTPIIENYKRIEAIRNWSDTLVIMLNETTEGGEVVYYYDEGKLAKIIKQSFGETFQEIITYYLIDGQLSFVIQKMWLYNRPIYYDQVMMEESGDTEYFDINKSNIKEVKCYFENSRPIHIADEGNLLDDLELHDLRMDFFIQFHKLVDLISIT